MPPGGGRGINNAMNRVGYLICTLVALLCVVTSGGAIWLARANGELRQRLGAQQELLTRGVLGPQGQEISGNILRTMAGVAGEDAAMRALLEKHGYRLEGPATNLTGTAAGVFTATGDAGAETPGAEEAP